MAPEQKAELILNITVEKHDLWSVDNPNLYQAKVSVLADEKEIDAESWVKRDRNHLEYRE